MRFPIPSHLHDIFKPVGENNSSFEVTGIIRCRCGHDRFLIESACNRQIVKLHCEKCSQEHLLFHAGKHGWDGFVCGGNTFHPDHTLPPFMKHAKTAIQSDTMSRFGFHPRALMTFWRNASPMMILSLPRTGLMVLIGSPSVSPVPTVMPCSVIGLTLKPCSAIQISDR